MNRVAVGADDIRPRVVGSPDVGAAQRVGVTVQAPVDDLPGLLLRERKNLTFVAFGLDMRLSRPMATFAPLLVDRQTGIHESFLMRIPVESRVNVGMTGAASD